MNPTTVSRCAFCGAEGTLVARSRDLTVKKRAKFGVIWVLISLFSLGIGFVLWLIWPRHDEVIGVDRYTECTACGSRI